MKKSLVIILAVVAVTLAIIGLISYSYRGSIISGFTGSSGGEKFTMYYADWCPHCQSVKPDFQNFMGSGSVTVNGKEVKVEMVSPEKEPEKVKGVEVKGYPTFLYSDASGKTLEYSGPRTPDGWMEFLKEQVLA